MRFAHSYTPGSKEQRADSADRWRKLCKYFLLDKEWAYLCTDEEMKLPFWRDFFNRTPVGIAAVSRLWTEESSKEADFFFLFPEVGCDGVEALSAPRLAEFLFLVVNKGNIFIKKKAPSLSAWGIPACQLFWFLSCFHYFVKGDVKRKQGESEWARRRGGQTDKYSVNISTRVSCFREQLRRVSVYLLCCWREDRQPGWRWRWGRDGYLVNVLHQRESRGD